MDTSVNKVSFVWNDASIAPDDYNLPVLCKTYNGKLLVFKNTSTMLGGNKDTICSGWSWLAEKYNIKYWCYQWKIN